MISIETTIPAMIDDVWEKTQAPDQHERWDLRFHSIEYLPRAEGEPQRFRYSTRLGLGLKIEGWGESVGERLADGVRTSALKFGSDSPWSMIQEGSGYWKYTPVEGGTKFETGYDYRVRWGALGRMLDLVFRPVMAWATAWSFDRLRQWIEKGTPPERAFCSGAIYTFSRLGLSFLWLYHGLVPKILFPQADERAMLAAAGISPELLPWIGVAECVFGLAILLGGRRRWLYWLTVAGMAGSLVTVLATSPGMATKAFNPVTLNVSVVIVALAGLSAMIDAPRTSRCRWSAYGRKGA